jgi:hypothetical protein
MVSSAIDSRRIERAITELERLTSGELRVSVAPYFWGSVRSMAEKAFTRLGMDQTRERNGVLFLVVPRRRRFVVLGDEAIHQKVGQALWDAVAVGMEARARAGDLTAAIEFGLGEVGQKLAEHFPAGAINPDELPNQLEHEGRSRASRAEPREQPQRTVE